MADYVKTTTFVAKADTDNIVGIDFDVEFDNIVTAVNAKADSNNSLLTGTGTAENFNILGSLDVDGAVTLDDVTVATGDINGGTIDGTVIGNTTPAAGTFTALTSTVAFTSPGIDDNATATTLTVDADGLVLLTLASHLALLPIARPLLGLETIREHRHRRMVLEPPELACGSAPLMEI